jgi:cellulose biosynthesis protein BcsQ
MKMSQLTIVLADTDEDFLEPLEKRFLETCPDDTNIIIITEEEYLHSFFGTQRIIDILVIHEELYSHELEKHNIASSFILTKEKPDSPGEDTFPKKIYLYSTIKEIYNEIYEASPLNTSQRNANAAKSIMVYSPIGGIGKTFAAMGLSAALTKAHKKVLFLSVEPLQSFSFFLTDPKCLDKVFINQLNARNSQFLRNLGTGIGCEFFDYMLPLPQSDSVFSTKLEKYQHYIHIVKEYGEYDFIVVDSPSDFTAEKSAMMAFCDKTVLLLGQHLMDVHKFERFLATIDHSNTGKFIFLCNKYDGTAKNHILNSDIRTQITISDYIPKLAIDQSDLNIEWFAACKYFEKLTYMLL